MPMAASESTEMRAFRSGVELCISSVDTTAKSQAEDNSKLNMKVE